MIEIHGKVREYDGRAEIILEEYRQLGGAGARIPPLPKNYDVEKKGRYSAGTFSRPKAAKHASKKRQPATLPRDFPGRFGVSRRALKSYLFKDSGSPCPGRHPRTSCAEDAISCVSVQPAHL
jgi:hypothetical protein